MPDSLTPFEIDLLSGTFYQAGPLDAYRWMRENAPVYYDAEREIFGVTRHEDVLTVSKRSEVFCSGQSSRPDAPPIPSMINMDDPGHKRRRNLVNRGFTPRRVEEQEVKVRQICNELVDAVQEKGECEFVREIAAPLPMILIGDMLGVAPEDRDQLLRWSDELLASPTTAEGAAALQDAFLGFSQYAMEVIRDRRGRRPQDDLISILCHAEVDGERLDDESIVQESLLILIGGDETTRHVISQGMETLIRNPDQRKKLVDDSARVAVAVEELLRWVSPIKNMNRTATRDTELRGCKIRAGQKLLLLYASANRDEAVFEHPDRFDVERLPNPHLAFGGYGTHFCLGAPLARLELRVMFDVLMRRLPDLELESEDPLPMRASNFIVGPEAMPVRFQPRRTPHA
ncbi:MAG: cytochrome P450 [Myxococcota bacterium]